MANMNRSWFTDRKNWWRVWMQYRARKGWGIRWSDAHRCWIATRPIGDASGFLAVRSFRELRRWRDLDQQAGGPNLVFETIRKAPKLDTFMDVGASNGIFGFAAHFMHQCKTIFIEPYPASIESILTTIDAGADLGLQQHNFEVLQGGVGSSNAYGKLYLYGPPKAGETKNAFLDPNQYVADGRHQATPRTSLWLYGSSLDWFIENCGLDAPTLIKVDIDGAEAAFVRGAKGTLRQRSVDAWIIELNGEENRNEVCRVMADAGYEQLAHQIHYEGSDFVTGDWLFVRDDLSDIWRNSVDFSPWQ